MVLTFVRLMNLLPRSICACLVALPFVTGAQSRTRVADGPSHLVFTSDAHFGLRRAHFRGADSVDALVVNAALVDAVNRLPVLALPADGGVSAGVPIGRIEALIHGGDIANRAEGGVQPAAKSWQQFLAVYRDGLRITDRSGAPSALWPLVGNHDASNAIGFYRPLAPGADPASWLGIYNMTMRPAARLTAARFTATRDRVHFVRDVGGVHFLFLHIWPDSAERAWIARELSRIPATMPVVLFTHDQPVVEAKHFVNPNGTGDINERDKFENLLTERLRSGLSTESPTIVEQRALATFIRRYPNIRGYFHGNSNAHEFYDWTGPDGDIHLPVFRVDSPMKGAKSASDEQLLSFMVISISADGARLTARECRYNSGAGAISWGETRTVALK
jgi:hypothetical protein